MERDTKRRLLFDERGSSAGRTRRGESTARIRSPVGRRPPARLRRRARDLPGILDLIRERGTFSILDPYLRLAGEGERILPFRVDGSAWVDVGRPADLREARTQAAARAGAHAPSP